MAKDHQSVWEGNDTLSKPATPGDRLFDKLFQGLTFTFTLATILLLTYILYEIIGKALPAISNIGFSFLYSTTWDVNAQQFGILPEIWGTLYSSLLALLLGGFFGVTI
ncbi:MAG TPA: phosphate ABC transporter permease subunit PstC, partial [Desulfobulbaceae bacterium]|nr:phosphate ABC transporter permease subunit PstC [Desulfobulbaceae bacterium]